MVLMTRSDARRFVAKIRITPTGCWEWAGSLSKGNRRRGDRGGYPFFWLQDENRLAHRVAYMAVRRRVPTGQLDHLCRNRACVRPSHLEDVSALVNVHRSQGLAALNAVKTVCVNGHPFTPENTKAQKGGRECAACRREIYKRYRRRRRERVA